MSSIRRAPRRDTFVVISNDTIRDERLSWKARGLLAYLLSLPDNWSVNITDLANRAPDGRDSVQTGLQQLEAAGYLIRSKRHHPDGTFEHESIVMERPDCPDPGFPDAGEPDAENPPLRSNQRRKNQQEEEPSSPARDLTRAREGPSTDAWEIAKIARGRADLIVHRVDRVAREVQALLDAGATAEEVAGAVEVMEPQLTVTAGTLGVGLSKWRLARTRERQEAERLDRSKSDLPYIVGKGSGRGSDGVNYDSLR